MEQLKEYLWTESFPLVFVLAFMAAIEAMAIVMSIAIRFRKVSWLLAAGRDDNSILSDISNIHVVGKI